MSSVTTIKIAGPAGTGIKSSGLLLSRILISHGFNVRDYSEYPSLVRGGHNTYQVSFSSSDIFAPHYQVDLMFSLISGHWQQHQKEFTPKTLVFGDDARFSLPHLGSNLYTNTICLGIAASVLGLNQKICRQLITKTYGSDDNLKAFDLGYSYAQENYSKHKIKLQFSKNFSDQFIYDGNEAYGWGFIQGKGDFYAAYPMTPASGAMHFLAQKQQQYKIKVLHPEDEIAAASLCAGAAFAGARSATGTSGGGFALMTESVSFCGAANLGVVFYVVSRPGPATGLPTWTSQGDLHFVVHSGHGEFNKIVLAPGDQQESFEFGALSLNLAAKFNLPVIVLSDKFISESGASLPDLSKKKFKIVLNKLPLPGTAGHEYMANSYEHDSAGLSTEDINIINKNTQARQSQVKQILKLLPKHSIINSKSSSLIISWGSTKSTILEALKLTDNRLAYLQIKSLWPLDPNIQKLIKSYKKIIVIENNATSQLTSLLKSQFDFNPEKVILKSDGRPFFPEELVKEFKKL